MQRSVHTSRVPLPSSTRCWDSREPLTCILPVSNLGGTERGGGERGGWLIHSVLSLSSYLSALSLSLSQQN